MAEKQDAKWDVRRGRIEFNQLIILLSKENRGEDIIKAAEDREYQEQLFKEFNL